MTSVCQIWQSCLGRGLVRSRSQYSVQGIDDGLVYWKSTSVEEFASSNVLCVFLLGNSTLSISDVKPEARHRVGSKQFLLC